MAKSRPFRSQDSLDTERETRVMIKPFLESRGFTDVKDSRRKHGTTESQQIECIDRAGTQMIMRVKLCWRKDEGHAKTGYAAAQLIDRVEDDRWTEDLAHFEEGLRKRGATHLLVVQRVGDAIEQAAQIDVDEVARLWHAQRAASAQAIASGTAGKRWNNHAENGHSPSLWLRDDDAPSVAKVLWEHSGVVDLAALPILAAAVSAGPPSREVSTYYARIAFNSEGWQRPSGKARDLEAVGTYNHTHGFGHEEWIFRNEWLIDGWRYSFLQGVNKSYERLVREQQPFDVILFTIDPQKRRRYVATIRSVECLSPVEAEDALTLIKAKGWFETMRREITSAGGNVSALENDPRAKHVLNVRFRVENVVPAPLDDFAAEDDPIQGLNRYILNSAVALEAKRGSQSSSDRKPHSRKGQDEAPNTKAFERRATAAMTCTPEHARMQKRLLDELKSEYPDARVTCEEDFIDILVQTKTERILFEIKSDRDPRAVIRQALGQILEYAYHPRRNHPLPVRLFIAGRAKLGVDDRRYLAHLREQFGVPVEYRMIEDQETLREET